MLLCYISYSIEENINKFFLMKHLQVTTHSPLLSEKNALRIAAKAGFPNWKSRCIRLQEFQTEQQFVKTLE